MSKLQLTLFSEKFHQSYGGILRKKAKNRRYRPLSSKDSMHLVMRSSQAKGEFSFRSPQNFKKVSEFIESFSKKKGVRILSVANVGNHLHFHIHITNRTLYKAWIRGLASGIAMIVLGREGFRKLKQRKIKFWDYRPFSRVVQSFRAFETVKEYLKINQFEGHGINRVKATLLVKGSRAFFRDTA